MNRYYIADDTKISGKVLFWSIYNAISDFDFFLKLGKKFPSRNDTFEFLQDGMWKCNDGGICYRHDVAPSFVLNLMDKGDIGSTFDKLCEEFI